MSGAYRRAGSHVHRPLPSRRQRVIRLALSLVLVLFVITAGTGGWLYQHLNANITALPLYNGVHANRVKEKVNASGQSPINILVIGSDARSNAADCALGGGCGGGRVQAGGANADVEMVVHVAADRSNATVMSLPRDLMTDVPACRDRQTGAATSGYQGMINSALSYGPGCQVATVEALTGIPIDHFVMVDFSGVVDMSDAVGGVGVCVSSNVYDTYSHLKLARGTHVLKGAAALEFLRSRHGFGDGGDLGRTYAQHLFLSALVRNVKRLGTLTDPVALYSLADAATKALTVDTGLGSIPRLIGLAAQLNQVPTDRITFVTAQTGPDPANPNRLVLAPAARDLFETISNDESLTATRAAASAKPGAATPPASASAAVPSVPRARIAVLVRNGSGISGRAATVASALIRAGFSSRTRFGTAPALAAHSTLTYGPGLAAQAAEVAAALGLPAGRVSAAGQASAGGSAAAGGTATAGGPASAARGLVLVIGSDWSSGANYPRAAATVRAATSGSHLETAGTRGQCAPVSSQNTVLLDGIPMTPAEAYARARQVPDSAP